MLVPRETGWVLLLVLTAGLSWVHTSQYQQVIEELRRESAELRQGLELAQAGTRDCLADLRATKAGQGTSLTAVPPPPPAPPSGRGNRGPTVRPRTGEQLFGPRNWPSRLRPDEMVRYSIAGPRCTLPFTYEGRTYNDCAPLTLPNAERGEVASQWCPVAPPGEELTEVTSSQLRQCQPNFNRAALVQNTVGGIYARIGACPSRPAALLLGSLGWGGVRCCRGISLALTTGVGSQGAPRWPGSASLR